MKRLIAVALAMVYWSVPGYSEAQDRRVCLLGPEGQVPWGGDCPDGSFATPREATAALGALTVAEGPASARICVANGFAHQLAIDNRDGSLGSALHITTEGAICPDGTLPGTEPAIRFAPGPTGDLLIPRLAFEPNAPGVDPGLVCAGPPRPGIKVEGPGFVILGGDGYIVGYEGYAVDARDADKPSVTAQITVLNGRGPALIGNGSLNAHNAEFSANTVGPGDPPALLAAVDGGVLALGDALIYGNLALGGAVGDAEALVLGMNHPWTDVSFVANAMVDVPLVRSGYRGVVEAQPNGELDPQKPRFMNLTFARNRALAAESAPPRAPLATYVSRLEAVRDRCAGDFPSNPAHRRPDPWTSEAGGAPLLELDPAVWQEGRGEASIYRSWFVGNDTGSAPLIELGFAGTELQVAIMHSLFADNASAGAVRIHDSTGSGRVSLARNLVLDPGRLLEVEGDGVSTLEVTMNAGPDGVDWTTGDIAAPLRVEGPAQGLSGSNLAWEDPDVLRALGARLQFDRVAVGATAAERSEFEATGGPWPCPTDRAAEFVPTADVVVGWWTHWPWDTGFLRSGSVGRFGPTGGSYALDNGPLDRSRDGNWGDSDGFSHLVDCDNDDPEVGPALPPLDGFYDPDCYEETCWSCPPGSNVLERPTDDDDAVGDDDSGERPEPTPAGSTEVEPPADCGCSGCGVYYSRPVGGALLLVGLVGLRRQPSAQV